MSHNTPKIGTATQDRVGALDTSISDLADVSGSPADGETLVYSSASSAFIPGANTRMTTDYIFIGRGESDAYTNTGQAGATIPATSDVWYYYDTNPQITITGASVTNVVGTDWIESITLPAGQYTIFSQHHAVFSSSGYLGVEWRIGSAVISSQGIVGENLSVWGGSASNCMGWINISSPTTINQKISMLSNVDDITAQGNVPSEFGYVLIRKVK